MFIAWSLEQWLSSWFSLHGAIDESAGGVRRQPAMCKQA
jgi:hypothetical protein